LKAIERPTTYALKILLCFPGLLVG
jgi:hypothetical protein